MIGYSNQSQLESRNVGLSRNLSLRKRDRARAIAKKIKSLVENSKKSSNKDEQCGFCSTQALIQNYSNFKQSGVPSRFMYYTNDTWVGFSREIFEFLKVGFLERKPILEISIEGTQYLIDFLRMLQIDLRTGNRRSISWIDANKKNFFPRVIVDEESKDSYELLQCPVKIKIKIDENSGKRKRNESYSDVESSESSSNDRKTVTKKPKSNPFVIEKERWPGVEILKEGDRSFVDIKRIFISGMKRIDQDIDVTSIYRCLHMDQFGVDRLKVFKEQVESTKAARGTANVRLAWCGTSSEGVAQIMSYGFDTSNKLNRLKATNGDGIYLSPAQSPETSALVSVADKNGEKHVMLCRVITGNIERVELGAQQCRPSSAEFDTGVDDLQTPKWYIVWSENMNTHILPEYIVSYKPLDRRQGLPDGVPIPKTNTLPAMSFHTLLSGMRSSLTSSSYQELESLYKLYKEGRVAKDVLIRQLRSVAGDHLITSTVRKVRNSLTG